MFPQKHPRVVSENLMAGFSTSIIPFESFLVVHGLKDASTHNTTYKVLRMDAWYLRQLCCLFANNFSGIHWLTLVNNGRDGNSWVRHCIEIMLIQTNQQIIFSSTTGFDELSVSKTLALLTWSKYAASYTWPRNQMHICTIWHWNSWEE